LSESIKTGVPKSAATRLDLADVETKGLKSVVQETTAAVEKSLIEDMLEKTHGKKIEAAKRLGISRPTLDAKIAAYGIKAE
jgi:DNA-binding NtrC family response regulator